MARELTKEEMLTFIKREWERRVEAKYPRHKLANDGDTPGQAVVTPSMIRADAVEWFAKMKDAGLVEGDLT